MKRSNRLVILVGVLLAVLAFVAIVVLLNQGPGTTAPEDVAVSVLVATEDIEIGEGVTPDKVRAVDVAPDAEQQTPIRDPSQLDGRPALVNIPRGAQVTQEKVGLGTVGALRIPDQLLPGEKAIAVQVDRLTGMGFLVQPGDVIDVVISQEVDEAQLGEDGLGLREAESQVDGPRTVKTVLQNKRVLYVSGNLATEQAPPVEGQPAPAPLEWVIVVFAGTDQDAEVVKFAQRDANEFGTGRTLSLVLRSPGDTAVETTTGVTLELLVSRYGMPVPFLSQPKDPEYVPLGTEE